MKAHCVVFNVSFVGALCQPRWVKAEGGEFGDWEGNASKVVVNICDGIPEAAALKVVRDSVPGAVHV